MAQGLTWPVLTALLCCVNFHTEVALVGFRKPAPARHRICMRAKTKGRAELRRRGGPGSSLDNNNRKRAKSGLYWHVKPKAGDYSQRQDKYTTDLTLLGGGQFRPGQQTSPEGLRRGAQAERKAERKKQRSARQFWRRGREEIQDRLQGGLPEISAEELKRRDEVRDVTMPLKHLPWHEGEAAKGLADEVLGLAQKGKLCRRKEVVTCLESFGKFGLWEQAIALLEFRREPHTYLAAMTATSKQWQFVLGLHDSMQEHSLDMTAELYDAVIASMSSAKKGQHALEFLDRARQCNQPPQLRAFAAGLRGCAGSKLWEKGLELMSELLKLGRTPAASTYHLGMILAGQGQKWEIALHFLEDMWDRSVPPGEVGYSSVIGACERSNRHCEAIELAREMRRKGFTVNKETFSSVWRACCAAGDKRLARDVATEMSDLGLGEPLAEVPVLTTAEVSDDSLASSTAEGSDVSLASLLSDSA